jgi:hypothetical protein
VYDHLGVKDLIAQEIEDSFAHPSLPRSQSLPALPSDHDDGDDNAHDGNAIAVLRCTGKRAIKGYICFPTGPLGESLSKPNRVDSIGLLDAEGRCLASLGQE